jgi:hypothetical protein
VFPFFRLEKMGKPSVVKNDVKWWLIGEGLREGKQRGRAKGVKFLIKHYAKVWSVHECEKE